MSTTAKLPSTIYKIMASSEWQAAKSAGQYTGSADDRRDGFVHFSIAAQLQETAARHFAGAADLVLVAVDVPALANALKWEPSRGGMLFPHLYAPLAIAQVKWSKPLPLGADGRYQVPAEVA